MINLTYFLKGLSKIWKTNIDFRMATRYLTIIFLLICSCIFPNSLLLAYIFLIYFAYIGFVVFMVVKHSIPDLLTYKDALRDTIKETIQEVIDKGKE